MDGVAKESGLAKKDIPLAAYKAGADILLMPEDVVNAITTIENAIKKGEISLSGLDERVRKVLSLKARMGLFEKSYSPIVDINGLEERIIVKENLDLMQQIAKNSMTVLFNDNSEGYGLPVTFDNKKIAYLGYKGAQLGREFAQVALKYGDIDTLILNDSLFEAWCQIKTVGGEGLRDHQPGGRESLRFLSHSYPAKKDVLRRPLHHPIFNLNFCKSLSECTSSICAPKL
jgi:beta-glucosidase-like glycosyl hydrolase